MKLGTGKEMGTISHRCQKRLLRSGSLKTEQCGGNLWENDWVWSEWVQEWQVRCYGGNAVKEGGASGMRSEDVAGTEPEGAFGAQKEF